MGLDDILDVLIHVFGCLSVHAGFDGIQPLGDLSGTFVWWCTVLQWSGGVWSECVLKWWWHEDFGLLSGGW